MWTAQTYLVAIVVPNFENLIPWAESKGIKDAKDPAKLVKDPAVKKFMEEQMTAVGTKMELRGFEFVKKIHVTAEDFR